MAQPHKGPREQIQCPVRVEVHTELQRRVTAGEASSVSQLGADLLAIAVGRPDLVLELDHDEALPLQMAQARAAESAQPAPGQVKYIKCRAHEDVYAEVKRRAAAAASSASQLAADLLAIAVDRPDLARDLGREELLLAM